MENTTNESYSKSTESVGLTETEKRHLGTKEVSKRVKQQLKQEFPECKFSVRTEYYSGGSSIYVSLMKSNIVVIKPFEDISSRALLLYNAHGYPEEQIKKSQLDFYHQLNKYTLRDEYNEDNWCNGVFITQEGHNLLQRVVQVVEQYNYDNSDPMTDYFDVNFYSHFEIGRFDKPFIQEVKIN